MVIRPEDILPTPEELAAFRLDVFNKMQAAGMLKGLRYEQWHIGEHELLEAYQKVELERAFDACFEGEGISLPSGYWTPQRASQMSKRNKSEPTAY